MIDERMERGKKRKSDQKVVTCLCGFTISPIVGLPDSITYHSEEMDVGGAVWMCLCVFSALVCE